MTEAGSWSATTIRSWAPRLKYKTLLETPAPVSTRMKSNSAVQASNSSKSNNLWAWLNSANSDRPGAPGNNLKTAGAGHDNVCQ